MQPVESPQIIDQFIREKIDQLLRERGLYKLTNHGWLNEEDIDPEQVGHAMWQLDDPADEVLGRMWEEPAAPNQLADWKVLCSVAGADFEGLMNGIRLSIGLALFQLECVEENFDSDDSLAAVHLRSAIVALGSASERVRQYFIAGVFRVSPGKYSGTDRTKRLYAAPFVDAVRQCEDVSQVHSRLVKLQEIASKVVTFEKTRNLIVHQVATELGRLRERAIEGAHIPLDLTAWDQISAANLSEIAANAQAEERRKIAEAVEMPIKWYKLLIEMAEAIFYVENRVRRAWQ